MQGSGNAYVDELSGNGWMTFFAAYRRNELDYDRLYATLPQSEADHILHALGAKLPFEEGVVSCTTSGMPPKSPLMRIPKHLVLVSVESLSAAFLGSDGSREGLTPNLDRLATEGYRFRDVVATGTRTVRGLEALSLGIPPIPGQSVVRRPANAGLATLGNLLVHRGFQALFCYGGHGYFDDMNRYFEGNNYEIHDRRTFPSFEIGFENVWGISDEDLYTQVLKVMDGATASGKRVFAHVMTTSNHRPYTYPEGRIDIPSPGGRRGAVKYTDYALGNFIERARRHPWFKDTLFVITADHCASVAGQTKLPLAQYRIPMIWYGPELVKPGVYEERISQIDVPPTLLEALGFQDGAIVGFGRSVFEIPPGQGRAFVSNYQALGYWKGDHLVVLLPKREIQAFHVDPRTLEVVSESVDPCLRDEAIAYYQTAARAFKSGHLKLAGVDR